ncbi:cyclin-domain-containing protein [Xylariales sp. PMI_506]|nr:cyclin-domain-containing protein [Xylariales sp. PMI_506]
MAAVIGDYGADHTRFHNMIASGLQHEHPHSRESSFRSSSRSRPRDPPVPTQSRSPTSPPKYRTPSTSATTPSKRSWDTTDTESTVDPLAAQAPASGGESRFPTPPDSSLPSSAPPKTQDSMASQTKAATPAANSAAPAQQPTPEADPQTSSSVGPPATPYNASSPQQGHTVMVRDLAHIQSLARAEMMNGGNGPGILDDPPLQAMKYEISGMPIGDIIEMVAALLTKITTTNDLQHDALHRNAAHQQTAASHNNDGASMSPLSSSVLAFHGKNVPAITILSYLSRIHKYCPTTYEVFLSLLVYFDRMTERVNNMVVQAEEARRQSLSQHPTVSSVSTKPSTVVDAEMKDDDSDDSDETDSDLADDDEKSEEPKDSTAPTPSALMPATYFVVDSFNIHRLIIAGVTCASKFFSDVFYTNSRYAKVGGLPLAELNHLELQFLILNDFRLAVPVEDLEAYATMLVEFYAREVVAPRTRPGPGAE